MGEKVSDSTKIGTSRSDRNLAQKVVRESLDEERIRDAVNVLLDALTSSEKTVWATCTHCHRKSEFPVLDAMTRVKALEQLQSLGWGRPKADDDERRAGFVLNRVVVEPLMVEVAGG